MVAGKKTAAAGKKTAVAGKKTAAEGEDTSLRPELKKVALVAPKRRNRQVDHLRRVLEEAEARLLLGWQHRALLLPALPKEPPFFEHAFSALDGVRAAGEKPASGVGEAQAALGEAVTALSRLRKIVQRTTAPGDPAREALKMGQKLQPEQGLVELGAEVLAGARKVRKDFPALTDEVLAQAESALDAAKKKVGARKTQRVKGSVEHSQLADEQQLALDVLLDSIDHLGAAALATLEGARPAVARRLSAALEKSSAPKGGSGGGSAPPAGGGATG